MTISPEIQRLANRLDRELDEIQQKANYGLNLLRPLIDLFPNNNILVSFFGSLNNALFLVEIYQRRIKANLDLLEPESVADDVIQYVGEELGNLLGRALEAKIDIESIIKRIERLA